MEDQSQHPPHRDDDLPNWNSSFAENNEKIKVLMAEALQSLKDRNQRLNAANATLNS